MSKEISLPTVSTRIPTRLEFSSFSQDFFLILNRYRLQHRDLVILNRLKGTDVYAFLSNRPAFKKALAEFKTARIKYGDIYFMKEGAAPQVKNDYMSISLMSLFSCAMSNFLTMELTPKEEFQTLSLKKMKGYADNLSEINQIIDQQVLLIPVEVKDLIQSALYLASMAMKDKDLHAYPSRRTGLQMLTLKRTTHNLFTSYRLRYKNDPNVNVASIVKHLMGIIAPNGYGRSITTWIAQAARAFKKMHRYNALLTSRHAQLIKYGAVSGKY